ncbi:Uncharacterised protein [Vibrio cholerae]|nr:Uncharacterised protein [Vibrio cholerae]
MALNQLTVFGIGQKTKAAHLIQGRCSKMAACDPT